MRKPVVIAIGVFDGVHLGHRALLQSAVRRAGALGGEPVAVTFDRHPKSVVAAQASPPGLMPRHLCVEKLRHSGMSRVVVLPFNRRLADTSAEDFARRYLAGTLRAAEVITGRDFRFGKGGRGDIRLLARLGVRHGFRVRVVSPVRKGGHPVSSTLIRRLITLGEVDQASKLLGHAHIIEGQVVQGHRLGRQLGFPTINLRPTGGLLPPLGVYAVLLGPNRLPGVANLGLRPTVEKHARFPLLEVHCLAHPPRVRLGALMRAEMLKFLRPELKFPGTRQLQRAVQSDIRKARKILRLPPPPPFFHIR